VDRPDLQRLLDDLRRGLADIIVVYKIDRLSRSLADFANLWSCLTSTRHLYVGHPVLRLPNSREQSGLAVRIL